MKLSKLVFIACLCLISVQIFNLLVQLPIYSGGASKTMELSDTFKNAEARAENGRQTDKLIDYSSCKYIQPGNVMPHYTCPRSEVKRFILLNNQISSSKREVNIEANIQTFSTIRNSRICMTGDSMVNQLFHSMECLLSHFNTSVKRHLHNTFFSEKYKMRMPGLIELSLPNTGSLLMFHGIKGPCKPENMGKIWEKCPPSSTDVLIFNIGYLHCTNILESFGYSKGINSKLNVRATAHMTEEIISNISRIFKNRKILLYGQPAPELVNYPNAEKMKKKLAKDKFFRHQSDRVILDLVEIEKSIAEKYNIHYIDSYEVTKSFLNEKERITWGKDFSLGRTDRVHFCLPGPVDFATNTVLEALIKN